MFEQDYIMRQIKECIDVIMKLVFGMDKPNSSNMIIQSLNKQALSDNLEHMLSAGDINEAIELLDTETKDKTKDDLLIAYNFYNYLFSMQDKIDEKSNVNFSEVKKKMYSYFASFGLTDEVIDLIFME